MNIIRRFFDVIARGRTYRNIAYVWLAFPLGLFYFIFLVTGSALSVGLSLLWIGLLLAMLFVLIVWALGQFERLLSKWLLDVPVALSTTSDTESFWGTIRGIFKDARTWKGALFLLLKFPVGLFCWCASVVTFAFSAAFIVAPFADYRGEVDLGRWVIQDPTGGWLLALFGILMLFPTLHLHNGMGALWRAMAKGLLNGHHAEPQAEPLAA